MKIVITIAPLIECSVDGAGVRIKANLDGSVDVTALAADYEHAQEPAEAPDAGEDNPMPRTRRGDKPYLYQGQIGDVALIPGGHWCITHVRATSSGEYRIEMEPVDG